MADVQLVVPSFEPRNIEKITSNFYRRACDLIVSGARVIGPSFNLETEIRDRCGFCVPKSISYSQAYYIGFTDNPHRPGILLQKMTDLDFPRGNIKVTLPSKNKMTFAPGSYLIDAEIFDTLVQELSVELP